MRQTNLPVCLPKQRTIKNVVYPVKLMALIGWHWQDEAHLKGEKNDEEYSK